MPSFPNRSFPFIVRWLNRFAQGVAPGVTMQLERFAELPLPVRGGIVFTVFSTEFVRQGWQAYRGRVELLVARFSKGFASRHRIPRRLKGTFVPWEAGESENLLAMVFLPSRSPIFLARNQSSWRRVDSKPLGR